MEDFLIAVEFFSNGPMARKLRTVSCFKQIDGSGWFMQCLSNNDITGRKDSATQPPTFALYSTNEIMLSAK